MLRFRGWVPKLGGVIMVGKANKHVKAVKRFYHYLLFWEDPHLVLTIFVHIHSYTYIYKNTERGSHTHIYIAILTGYLHCLFYMYIVAAVAVGHSHYHSKGWFTWKARCHNKICIFIFSRGWCQLLSAYSKKSNKKTLAYTM